MQTLNPESANLSLGAGIDPDSHWFRPISMFVEKAESLLSVTFINKVLLVEALTHKTFVEKASDYPLGHNQRLEFLGDSTLRNAVVHYVYRTYPFHREGFMTKVVDLFVSNEYLADCASELGLESLLLRPVKAEKPSSKHLSDALEALIGAIDLDQGMEAAHKYVLSNILPEQPLTETQVSSLTAKHRLHNLVYGKEGVHPTYTKLYRTGDHREIVWIGVFSNGREIGRGAGMTEKEAVMNAAVAALETYR